MKIRIGTRNVGTGFPPYVIAEIGVNHDGELHRAISLIDAAADAGADAVKFQYFVATSLLSSAAVLAAYQRSAGAGTPLSMLQELELPLRDLATCLQHAQERGLHSIVTVFSFEHVAEAAQLPWVAFKTASPDIINHPLTEQLIMHAAGRPMILSTGAAELDEVRTAIELLHGHPHALMQCVSSYPTPLRNAALGGMLALRSVSRAPIGYSDHTPDVLTGALAIAAGASILEKHLTWNRDAPGPDHAASLDPGQFADYARLARDAHAAIGSASKQCGSIERDVRHVARQSVTSVRPLPSGHVIGVGDLTLKRPGTGLPPSLLHALTGCSVVRDIPADMPVMAADVRLHAPAGMTGS